VSSEKGDATQRVNTKWAVAIFSSRESLETLGSSIDAAIAATSATESVIDVIVNGDRCLAERTASYVQALRPAGAATRLIRLWYVLVGDKGHAWNQYLYDIWPESEVTFFLDGYAQVLPDALGLMWDMLVAEPRALAVSGMPTIGRSAKKVREVMLRDGGIHGTLHALKGVVVAQLRAMNFRLPLGIYRTDPTMGAVLCFGLDPARNDWDITRIAVHPKATWTFQPLNWKSIADLRRHYKRVMRQAQGTLENLAVHDHLAVQRKSPATLPRTTFEMVSSWTSRFPRSALKAFISNPLCFLAARTLRRPHDWSQTRIPPELLARIRV